LVDLYSYKCIIQEKIQQKKPIIGRGGPILMTQQKRWATGMLEILISRRSPIIATVTPSSNLDSVWRTSRFYFFLIVDAHD